MNKWKTLAIIFTLLSLGSLKETIRIFTSDAPDIAPNRTGLSIMALTFTGVIIFFTIRFWKKASEKRLY
jgi:hypothetical protein